MTVKELLAVTAKDQEIQITNSIGDFLVLSQDDPLMVGAFGDYVIESIAIRSEQALKITLKTQYAKEKD